MHESIELLEYGLNSLNKILYIKIIFNAAS